MLLLFSGCQLTAPQEEHGQQAETPVARVPLWNSKDLELARTHFEIAQGAIAAGLHDQAADELLLAARLGATPMIGLRAYNALVRCARWQEALETFQALAASGFRSPSKILDIERTTPFKGEERLRESWQASLDKVKRNARRFELERADVDHVQLVTSDVERFWTAFDMAQGLDGIDQRIAAYREHYFDGGSEGLRDFMWVKIRSVRRFVETIDERQEYYRSLRPAMLGAGQHVDELRRGMGQLQQIYPAARFPDVTFLVGRMNSAGTVSGRGMLIGLEMSTRAPDSPLQSLPFSIQQAIGPPERLARVVLHELVHTLQDQGQGGRSLLMASLMEGSADYLARLALPNAPVPLRRSWGLSHEERVWREFQSEMHGTETKRWRANNDSATPDWPADLGYFMGAQIVEAFYEGSENKQAALAELMRVTDPFDLLRRSGYGASMSTRVE